MFSVTFEESLAVVDLWCAHNLRAHSKHCYCNDIEHVGSPADCMGNLPTDGSGDPSFVRSNSSTIRIDIDMVGSNDDILLTRIVLFVTLETLLFVILSLRVHF